MGVCLFKKRPERKQRRDQGENGSMVDWFLRGVFPMMMSVSIPSLHFTVSCSVFEVTFSTLLCNFCFEIPSALLVLLKTAVLFFFLVFASV